MSKITGIILVGAALMGGCTSSKTPSAVAQEQNQIVLNGPASAGDQQNQTGNNIRETKDWKDIEDKWENMDKVKVSNFEKIYDKIQQEQKEMERPLNKLVKGGYLTSVMAEAINFIYGENLRSTLEKTVVLPECYKPMSISEWDCAGVDSREELQKKLALIEELYKKGNIKKDVLDKAKENIRKRIKLLDYAEDYWKKNGKSGDHSKEIDVLLHLYDQNTGGIKEGKKVEDDLIKASEYIVILEKNN